MKTSHKKRLVKIKRTLQKQFSVFLAILIFIEVSYPTQVFALTGGPSQPEVQSFEPISTSDMVDVFSGDFNYNIPLLDIDGYPINIAYNSGISTDQEASWVGLGWNINPGVINRNMRGLPDDFSGDIIEKEISMKPNKTWGVAANVGIELFGAKTDGAFSLGLGASLGINFNNYTGPSIQQSINANISAGVGGAGKLTGGLGLTSNSDDGLTIQPSIGFSAKVSDNDKGSTSVGLNIGTSFNSRGGLKQLSISTSVSSSVKGDYMKNGTNSSKNTIDRGTAGVGKDYTQTSGSLGSASGPGGTFDFGMATYTPKIDMSMKNFSMSGSFTLGGEIWGINAQIGVSGFYSAQELAQNNIQNPAYGYLYAQNGQYNDNALMDFNREKDGTFTENTPSLPLTNFTFDTYGVSGQGIGGSYRPFRGDIGYVFDPTNFTTNDNDALTAELGFGGYVHVGTNVTVIDVSSTTGKWKSGNPAISTLVHTPKGNGNDFENVYFKEASEKTVDSDPTFYSSVGEDQAVRFDANFGKFDHSLKNGFVKQNGQSIGFSSAIKRKKRDKKSQNISFLTNAEYNDFAVEKMPNLSPEAKPHHIGEVTTLSTDGSRYIYGLPAYNTEQKEITFSVGSTDVISHTNSSSLIDAAKKGLVGYSGSDNSSSNQKGVDNYFSSTKTPPYAHSYLITSVLAPDYIDADGIRGPSDGDFGSYTKFRYKKIADYEWRTPIEANKATFTENLKSNFQDDKGNIIYGKKDMWYLDTVITKNYIAVFHKSNRHDGVGVNGVNGGLSASKKSMKLDSISLYSKRDLRTPIKRVHFEYSYDLCPNVPNNDLATETANGININRNHGKLTLKKIFFTYQNSNLARLSPYVFNYNEVNPSGVPTSENPAYNIKAYDRWGNYKPNNAITTGVKNPGDANLFVSTATLAPSDYPYVEQVRNLSDVYSAVWTLKEINLPSGGTIKLSYESDDYAYVQNKQAGEMFKIVKADGTANDFVSFTTGQKLYFKLHNGETDVSKYVKDINYMYFRFLVNIRTHGSKPNLEYVPGYGKIGSYGYDSGSNLGWITLQDVNLNDNGGGSVSPIQKTAIQYGRLHLPKVVWDATSGNMSGTLSGDILKALINSSFIKNIKDAAMGQNAALKNSYNVAEQFIAGKSWVRLTNPDGHKLGGGIRVKKIEMIDNWKDMVGTGNGENSNYGQEYFYNSEDGKSSGVATYEPQLGGDENCFKQPIFVSEEKLWVPDDQSYVEEPFGETFFPSPSVGYGRVTVKNLQRTNVSRHATGSVVHEFYTAKDFPTITSRTEVYKRRGKDDPGSIRSLLKINTRDYLAATQGFVIELNDMHGKPKTQKVYQEGQQQAITSVEYKYKSSPYLNGCFKLNNDCQVVEKNGATSQKNIGLFFDMVADYRESKTETNSTTVGINVDVIPILGYPVPIPMIWPSFAKDKSRFRSATLTKVVQRFGILEETIASDLGSVVAAKNLAYDAETGDVLLTQTTTNYNDKVYSLKYPAWWYYANMGPAYENLGFEINSTTNFSSSGEANVGSAAYLFKEGDELALYSSSGNLKGWVTSIAGNVITVIKKGGASVNGGYRIKIIRSGKKNNLTTEMASITTLSNPLASLASNSYQDVLQATAVEFSNKRKTHCNCIQSNSAIPYTANPYVSGLKGTWRPLKSYTHLTTRSQSNTNNNTNIRKDGVFESYSPYYKLDAGNWQIDEKNWTYVSEVTEFNVFGEEVENKDALGRKSSATFGYNQTMALSVAANTPNKEQGFDGFEDYRFNPCIDDHFKFDMPDTTRTEAHTGRYSIKVHAGAPKYMSKQIVTICDEKKECDIRIEKRGSENSYAIIGGTPAYSITWNVLSGAGSSPNVALSSGGIVVTSPGSCSIQVTVTDAKGCVKTITITKK